MTDSDDKLLHRYRALPREEPPRALDDAILAASRRAVTARPSLSRRWAAPVSIAAVLVLAFGVTLEMQREEPGIEYQAPKRREAPAAPAPLAKPQAPVARDDKAPAAELRRAAPQALKKSTPMPRKEAPAATPMERVPEAFTPPPPQLRSAPAAPPPASMDSLRDANVAPAPAASPLGSAGAPAAGASSRAKAMSAPAAKAEAEREPARTFAAPAEPERELERIARLRDEGRDEEADQALEEFRRKHPDYRIPEAMWSRVKPR